MKSPAAMPSRPGISEPQPAVEERQRAYLAEVAAQLGASTVVKDLSAASAADTAASGKLQRRKASRK